MSLCLTILGCHSATPRKNAFPTAQFLEINHRHFLIDCGEGTQRQMRKYKVGFSKIDQIFISHLHGDHFFGLVGLLSTYGILNREKEIHVYGPKGIKQITELSLKVAHSHSKFPIIFHELSGTESELIYEDDKVTVHTLPLDHRVYTNGYLFKEKEKPRNLNIEAVRNYPEIEKCDYNNLKLGKDFITQSGTVIPNKELTLDPPAPLSYAFCSDTAYLPNLASLIENVDLLYHESTFLTDKEDLATKTKHSTALQAALVAKDCRAKQLILGHYSGRYQDINRFKEEAEKLFPNVYLSEPGKVFEVRN